MSTNKDCRVITFCNILAPHERTLNVNAPFKNSDEILASLKYDPIIFDVVIAKNSVIQKGFFTVEAGDIINVSIVPKGGGGGGRKVLGIVVAIVLTVVTYGAGAMYGGALAGSIASSTGVAAATASAMATGLITAVGAVATSLIVGAIMPKPKAPTFDGLGVDGFKQSNSYGWSVASNMVNEGTALPKVFGTHKITPPLIARHVTSYGDTQYLNCLYALNDGEIESVTDIRINNEPISNFKGVSTEIRLGHENQDIIPAFNDTYVDIPVGKKISDGWCMAQTTGNAVTELKVTLLMPKGLYYANNKGGMSDYSLDFFIEYSADKQTWISMVGSKFTVTSNATHPIRRVVTAINLKPNQYYVRIRFVNTPKTTSRYGSDAVFETLTEGIKDDVSYPKTALLAMRALATDQLNGGMPVISCVVKKGTSNPALIAKQILLDCGIPPEKILPSFDEWADFCAEKKYTCNIVFDTTVNLRQALDMVSTMGRANIIQAGSRFDVVVERENLFPTQNFLFGMGNILSKSFKQSFLPLNDRAGIIEITYYDKEKEYEKTVITVGDDPKRTDIITNKASINLIGCTDKKQAQSYGRFLLNQNRYITQTVEFDAMADSLVCRYGDVIKVSHDVPSFGFSGRLVADSGEAWVELDRDVALDDGKTYGISLKDELNNVHEFLVITQISPRKLGVDLNGAKFKSGDIYAVGEIKKISKLFRVIKISVTGEFTRRVVAIEYNEDVYKDSQNIEIINSSSRGISGLKAVECLTLENRQIKTRLFLNWVGDSLYYDVIVNSEKGDFSFKKRVYSNYCDFIAPDEAKLDITVKNITGQRANIKHVVVGKTAPPPAVSNLQADDSNFEYVKLEWDYDEAPLDFKEFLIYVNDKEIGKTIQNHFTIPITKHTFVARVIAIDTSGVKSAPATWQKQQSYLSDVENFSTMVVNGFSKAVWDRINTKLDVEYEVKRGSIWNSGTSLYVGKDTSCEVRFLGEYLLKAVYINEKGLKFYSKNPNRLIVDESLSPVNVVKKATINKKGYNKTQTEVSFYNSDRSEKIGSAVSVITPFKEFLSLDGDYDNADLALRQVLTTSAQIKIEAFKQMFERPTIFGLNSFIDYLLINLKNNFDLYKNVDAVGNIDTGEIISTSDVSLKQTLILYKDQDQRVLKSMPYKNGEYFGTGFEIILDITCHNADIAPLIKSWEVIADVPDIIESGSAISSQTGEVGVLYKERFNAPPQVQITILNAQSGDDAILSKQGKTGFEIKVLDAKKEPVQREINYIAKGY